MSWKYSGKLQGKTKHQSINPKRVGGHGNPTSRQVAENFRIWLKKQQEKMNKPIHKVTGRKK